MGTATRCHGTAGHARAGASSGRHDYSRLWRYQGVLYYKTQHALWVKQTRYNHLATPDTRKAAGEARKSPRVFDGLTRCLNRGEALFDNAF